MDFTEKLSNPFTSCGPLWVRNAPKPSPGVPKEMSQHFLVVVQIEHGDQEALDDLPGLLTVVRLGGGGLERVEGRLHGTLHGEVDRALHVLEVHLHARANGLTLIVVQLEQNIRIIAGVKITRGPKPLFRGLGP